MIPDLARVLLDDNMHLRAEITRLTERIRILEHDAEDHCECAAVVEHRKARIAAAFAGRQAVRR